jgi:hypothetical protein
MSGTIRDDHAIAFAAHFYETLAFGHSVQEAFDVGLWRLENEGYSQAKTLVRLHTKSGVDADSVTLIGPPPMASAPAVSQPATDRTALLRDLRGLTPSDLAMLIAAIPGASAQVSHQGTVPQQVAQLIGYAESTNGPGLDAISKALASFR